MDLSDLDLRKVASLDAFLRVAVEWEVFRSRWHIAAINRDSSAYRADLERRFRASTKDGRFGALEPYVNVVLPTQLSVVTVQRFLDPLGRNISFGDKWTDRAKTELAAPLAAKVRSLSPADLLLVTACEKTRNAIVHKSSSSIDEMNTALVVLDPKVDGDLVRTNRVTGTGIAAYLHAWPLAERRVKRDKLVLCIDRARKLVSPFEVVDFKHFVSYHLLDEIFGDQVVPSRAGDRRFSIGRDRHFAAQSGNERYVS